MQAPPGFGCPTTDSNLTTKTPYIAPEGTDQVTTPTPTALVLKKVAPKAKKAKGADTERKTKVFVIDTSVLLHDHNCLLYTSPSPRDLSTSRMPSSA